MAWVATAIVGSAVLGAGASIYTSSKAAEAQKEAALAAGQSQVQAAQIGAQSYERLAREALGYIKPYAELGNVAGQQLQSRLGELTNVAPINLPTVPGTLTQEELEKTPGYQFTQYQGLKSVQNSAAARGLGVSGAALKGAAAFATGLASSTYAERFKEQQELYQKALERAGLEFEAGRSQKADAYNRLKGLVDTGASAAGKAAEATTGIGKTQQQAAQNIGQAQAGAATGAAAAEAAGYNVAGGAVNQAAGNIGGYLAYKSIYGNPNTVGGKVGVG